MAKLEPIKVRVMAFVSPQDGPGMSTQGALSTKGHRKDSRHVAEYWPWMRAFMVRYEPRGDEPTRTGFIPEGRVMWWEPFEVPQPPGPPQGQRKG